LLTFPKEEGTGDRLTRKNHSSHYHYHSTVAISQCVFCMKTQAELLTTSKLNVKIFAVTEIVLN